MLALARSPAMPTDKIILYEYTLKQLALLVKRSERTISRYVQSGTKLYGVRVRYRRPVAGRGASYDIANDSYEEIKRRMELLK